jgi:adenine-specific DNA-methyltransferase
MTDKIASLKHTENTRVHIPSHEEQGYEEANLIVQQGKRLLDLPLNPVTTRGQDPELFWMNKYGADDREELLKVDIRSLYRHEHIAPERLIKNLYRIVEDETAPQPDLFGSVNELFGNALEKDELQKIEDYYTHHDGWTNRLIQGDSHLVMASLLEREGMAGQVQMVYIDPPYGIKYGSNWQVKLNNRDVKDGADDNLTGEPEVIKAFRDTWELGIHSYLSYIRDRLLIARELLTESGSCFVQISDENVHLVRSVMDEVFGSGNFVAQINFKSTSALGQKGLAKVYDYIVWYGKNIEELKFRPLFKQRDISDDKEWRFIDDPETEVGYRKISDEEFAQLKNYTGIFRRSKLTSSGFTPSCMYEFELGGQLCKPFGKKSWVTHRDGMANLIKKNRLFLLGNSPYFKQYFLDFPVIKFDNSWSDQPAAEARQYVVQTARKFIERCLLMTTDPGDLVLDPTCGSGTTAFVAEHFGRRWITIDTSRIALNIAKTRLMTAAFPYYHLYSNVKVDYLQDDKGRLKANITPLSASEWTNDIRQGFVYEIVPHITIKSLANDEPPATETLYDRPIEDKKRLRVCGAFTVETLQNFEPVSPDELDDEASVNEQEGAFEEVVRQHLLSTGVKNGRKNEQVIFTRIEVLSHAHLHAEGFYQTAGGEKKAYFHIGPKFGTVSKTSVNEAIKECRARGDADWLVILGFSFESDIQGGEQTTSLGSFTVTKARIHDDLLQEGLKKKPAKSAASFVTIGEPDIVPHREGNTVTLEIQGLDIYDPIKDEVKARDLHDIAYWMVDDDYDGSNFVVRQVFFCGGEKDEFIEWKKGLSDLAKETTKARAEKTLKIEIDDEAFDRIYGFRSHPIEIKKKNHRIAVRLISQFGEESMRVFNVS